MGSGDELVLENRMGSADAKGGKKGDPPTMHKVLLSLAELPARCWVDEPHDDSGVQFFTQLRIGRSYHKVMLDTGSAVNSVTEELVLQVLNEKSNAGMGLNDPRHPVKQLGSWKHRETLRGVAGGAAVPLVGTVVVGLTMVEAGKDNGPEVRVRFKITKKGTTDWVGWILGARMLDCAGRGSLGFVFMERTHAFTTWNEQRHQGSRSLMIAMRSFPSGALSWTQMQKSLIAEQFVNTLTMLVWLWCMRAT